MTRVTAIIAGWMVCLAGAGAAPQSPPQPPPRFRAGVEVVQVDVSVLDRDRRPVRGLTAADFTILEDGQPQPIVAFSEIHVPEPAERPTAWMREVPPDIRRNDDLADRRLVVLVLDDAQMPQAEDAAFVPARVREVGRSIVGRLAPDDLAAVVFTVDTRKTQQFTDDRALLLAAVDRFTPGFVNPLLADEYSLGTLSQAAAYLAEIPQRRKAVIYVGLGIRMDFEALATPIGIGEATGDVQGSVSALAQQMRQLFLHAPGGHVTIYGVDPLGLQAPTQRTTTDLSVDPAGRRPPRLPERAIREGSIASSCRQSPRAPAGLPSSPPMTWSPASRRYFARPGRTICSGISRRTTARMAGSEGSMSA